MPPLFLCFCFFFFLSRSSSSRWGWLSRREWCSASLSSLTSLFFGGRFGSGGGREPEGAPSSTGRGGGGGGSSTPMGLAQPPLPPQSPLRKRSRLRSQPLLGTSLSSPLVTAAPKGAVRPSWDSWTSAFPLSTLQQSADAGQQPQRSPNWNPRLRMPSTGAQQKSKIPQRPVSSPDCSSVS